jgi:hypothetical protein
MDAARDPPERRRATSARAAPRAPTQPVPERVVLSLQRTAGNAAVARMLTGARRRSLQRKIGFELEAGDWWSALLDRPPEQSEQETGAVPKTAQTKPPDARKAFYGHPRVEGPGRAGQARPAGTQGHRAGRPAPADQHAPARRQ